MFTAASQGHISPKFLFKDAEQTLVNLLPVVFQPRTFFSIQDPRRVQQEFRDHHSWAAWLVVQNISREPAWPSEGHEPDAAGSPGTRAAHVVLPAPGCCVTVVVQQRAGVTWETLWEKRRWQSAWSGARWQHALPGLSFGAVGPAGAIFLPARCSHSSSSLRLSGDADTCPEDREPGMRFTMKLVRPN